MSTQLDKYKKISNLLSLLISIVNIILIIQTNAQLMGIKINFANVKLTRQFLLKHQGIIKTLSFSLTFVLIFDMVMSERMRDKYGEINYKYGLIVSSYVFFVSLLCYYTFGFYVYIYYAVLSALSLTYYLTIINPIEQEVKIKSKKYFEG